MFLAEFFVPFTLNMGIRFRNRIKGMFLSLAHFQSIKIMFAPLSNKASAEMKDFFPFGDILIFKMISLSLLILLVICVSSGISSSIFCGFAKRNQALDSSLSHTPDKLKMPLGMVTM